MQADRQRLRTQTSLPARWVVAAAALSLASGCSVLEEDKIAIGSSVGRQIVRGILGAMLKGR